MLSNPHDQELPESQKTPPSDDVLLHQYDTIVDLYKHHLDLALKANIFIYGVTGAILSFYLSQPNSGLMPYALLFPCFMNLYYFYFFLASSNSLGYFADDLKAIIERFNLISCPDIMALKYFLRLSAALFLAISIGLSLIPLFRG